MYNHLLLCLKCNILGELKYKSITDILQHELSLPYHKKVKLSNVLRDLLTLTHSHDALLLLSSS